MDFFSDIRYYLLMNYFAFNQSGLTHAKKNGGTSAFFFYQIAGSSINYSDARKKKIFLFLSSRQSQEVKNFFLYQIQCPDVKVINEIKSCFVIYHLLSTSFPNSINLLKKKNNWILIGMYFLKF